MRVCSGVAAVTQAQIAATVAAFVGKDYRHDKPKAALPLAGVVDFGRN